MSRSLTELATLAAYAARGRAHRFLHPALPHLVFVHVPKTGGTSVDAAFSAVYGRKNSYRIDPALTGRAIRALKTAGNGRSSLDKFQLREALVLAEMAKGTKYITGHVHFNADLWTAYRDQYVWVTVLRDPVKRYISQYFFDAYKPAEHARVTEPLDDFITTERGIRRGQNYINYFGPFYRDDPTDPEEKLAAARENLSKFDVVGFLDDLDGFKQILKDRYGLSLSIPHVNKSPVAKPTVEASVRREIERICAHDVRLYTYAREQYA